MVKQLLVIDGADEGRVFPLNDGIVTIGNSRRNTDICLHDLLMSRVHCELEVAGDRIVVTDEDNSTGTLVNGQKVKQQELHLGDVIRIGNSFLRLQVAEAAETEVAAEAVPVAGPAVHDGHHGKLPVLPLERMEELVGDTLGHYQLDAVLGKGHCGVVFRAHDLKVDRVVALKVLQPDFPRTEGEMQQFVRILKTLLPLRHQHMVGYWGAGRAAHYCWIAMEYIEGESITQVLQRTLPDRKIPWQRGFRVALHVGRALHYIQQRHQFHGNITPQNIFVRTIEEGNKVVKLNDFLFAQAIEGSAVQLANLEGKLLAELPYLSPEQTQGDAYVDSLSDVYSLGVVAYHLLTGHLPFKGKSVEETLELIQDKGPPIKPRKYQKAIPQPVERIVMRMLAKRQEDRYQRAEELVAELERVAEQEELPV